MRNSHPLEGNLAIDSNVGTKILANELLIMCIDNLGSERSSLFCHRVHIALEFRKHCLTIESSLISFDKLVENIELLFSAGGLVKLSVRHKKLVYGRCNLGYEDGIAGILRLVVAI